MPTNRKESLIYTMMEVLVMTLFMGIANMSIAEGGVSSKIVICAIETEIFFFVFAFIMESLFVGKVVTKFIFSLINFKDSANAKIICMSTFTVLCMSAFMTLFGVIFLNGFHKQVFLIFMSDWPRNFVIALFFQWVIAGPLGRRLLDVIFKRKKKQEITC